MDEHAGVRRHALMLITELLLQSFVKLRGPILYLLLGTMLDSDPETAEAAQHAVLEVFSKRDPTLIPTCFVETMFVMNACKDHPKYNVHDDRLQTLLASFYGPGEATLKRRRLYQLMLSSMSNENKIRITARLCQDILGNVVDGVIVLSDHTQAVSSSPVVVPTPGPAAAFEAAAQTMSFEHADFYLIQDTFAILCSDAARVHTTSDGTAQVQQEVIENAEAAASVAKNKLLSKIAHKNALQNVVPCIISLKRQLERIHSPLLKSVMSYFSFLFRFHRRELDNALAEDPTVAAEIQYDLRKMDEQEKKEEEEEEKRRMSLSSKKKKTPGTARSSVRTAKKMKNCLSTSRKDLQRLSVPRVRGTPKNDDEDEEDLSSCVRTLDSALAPLTNQVQTKSLSSPKRRRSLRQKTKSVSSSDEDAPARKKKPVQDC
jgi:condensin-2 complex subunit D3